MSTVRLIDGDIVMRPLRWRDGPAWQQLRARNADWLRPWEATLPPLGSTQSGGVQSSGMATELPPPTYGAMLRRLRQETREGRTVPWAIEVDGRLVGQLTVGGIAYSSLRSAYIGYWIGQEAAGRGFMPTAVALACDDAFERLRLHRIEINIRPENAASKRVVEKLGLRCEGVRPKYLHIDGDWRDHESYVVFAGEFQPSVIAHWHRRQALLQRETGVVPGEHSLDY